MSRNAILARIRAANPNPQSPPHEAKPAPASLASTGADAGLRFRTAAEAKGVTVVDIDHPAELPLAIARTHSAANLRADAIRLNDPALLALPWSDANLTITRGAAEPHDMLALSSAVSAVAETGSLLLASGPDNPSSLAFLPETHLVTIARSTIVGTFEEAFALLRTRYGNSLPRAVNIISGASGTGDIGGRIVQGAHGPRQLFVFIT
jgi:L-lactate dehydrogenase complex protein LldG